jgi:hypothetical protein
MFRQQVRSGLTHVGLALRDSEEFAIAWNEGRGFYRSPVWGALLATAIAGTTTYGMTTVFQVRGCRRAARRWRRW